MDIVKVDDVRLQPPAGFVEKAFEIIGAFHDPPRGLGGDVHPVAVAARQRFPCDHLALAPQIDIACIHIVPAVVHGVAHHVDALRLIHVFAVGEHGQAHMPKPSAETLTPVSPCGRYCIP